MTDRLICRLFEIPAPDFLTLSATVRLPLASHAVEAADAWRLRQQLRELLIDNADEPFAVPLAAALQGQYLETTTQLAALVRQTLANLSPSEPHWGEYLKAWE